jgi:hypothetical protein
MSKRVYPSGFAYVRRGSFIGVLSVRPFLTVIRLTHGQVVVVSFSPSFNEVLSF